MLSQLAGWPGDGQFPLVHFVRHIAHLALIQSSLFAFRMAIVAETITVIYSIYHLNPLDRHRGAPGCTWSLKRWARWTYCIPCISFVRLALRNQSWRSMLSGDMVQATVSQIVICSRVLHGGWLYCDALWIDYYRSCYMLLCILPHCNSFAIG